MEWRLARLSGAGDQTGLLLRVAAGDRTALAAIFEAEAGWLLGVALRIIRRRDLAEEVLQDSFVAIWRSAGRFDPARGAPRAWLATIVRNRALNLARDHSRLELMDADALAELGDSRNDASEAYDRLPDSDALRRCLGLLEANKRQAILLAYVSGMTHGEVAGRLNAPLGTVKAWIRRGTLALQECLS